MPGGLGVREQRARVAGHVAGALRAPAQDCCRLGAPAAGLAEWCPGRLPADEMNDQQNTLSYVLINPPPDTRLEPNDIV